MSTEPNRFQIAALEDFQRIRRAAALRDAVEGNWSDLSREAALFFAQALGYCRLWAVELGEQDGSIPLAMLPEICQLLTRRIRRAIDSLSQYERDMDLAVTAEEAELYSSGVLRQRMDGWAMWIAIDERLQMAVDEPSSVPAELANAVSGPALTRLLDVLEQWDVDLQARSDLLTCVKDTYLLENWREALGEEFSLALPWWLDEAFWDAVVAEPIADYTLARQERPTPETTLPQGVESLTSGPLTVQPALDLAGAGEAEVPIHLRFRSRSDRSRSAIADVRIPRRFAADGSLTIEIQYLFADHEPAMVRSGGIVALGGDVAAVIVAVFSDEGVQYRTQIELTRSQYEKLQLSSGMRLRVNGRQWIPE